MTDRSAEIAKFIMHSDSGPDPRDLVMDLLKVFGSASGDEIKRGMEIAVEVYEATEIVQPKGDVQ